MRRLRLRPAHVLLIAAAVAVGAAAPAAGSAPAAKARAGAAAGYAGTHFGDGNIPAGCIVDRDEANPDNHCFHMKVGLNALDSPEVNVAVLVPVSPTAERDARMMRQAVQMWDGGIHDLAQQMNLQWLNQGVHFHVTTDLVPVDANGLPTQVIRLVQPKIIVIATNPAGGIGIGIDPVEFAKEAGLDVFGPGGVPCGSFANPFSMQQWMTVPGFDDHHGELGGIYVHRCDGPGGNVCFSINGAVDPVPGKTDFFSIFDLVAHETGHCLTLGHVGDGADGPWGPTPTNDIMSYSSDPVDLAKCVSTLDVEGFALRMSNFIDVNGDGKINAADVLVPNDKAGDGLNSFQIQNPKDHWYASSTGRPEDCPQPDWGTLPIGAHTNWDPAPIATTAPRLRINAVRAAENRVSWSASAGWVSTATKPTKRSGSVSDVAGDGTLPVTDITGFTAKATRSAVKATIKVDKLWPTTQGGRVTGYGLYVGGRKFDSFVTTQGTGSDVQTIDSGARYLMPAGTSKWNTKDNTVSFTIPRSYLLRQRIQAPYSVFAETGVHIRTKDWVMSLDRAPDAKTINLAAPRMTPDKPGAPFAKRVTTHSFHVTHAGGNTFTPADTSDAGVPLVPAVGNVHEITVPVAKQSTVTVKLTWDDPNSALGLAVEGGSGQQVKTTASSVTVTVPWAHHDLTAQVIPTQVLAPSVNYTVAVTTKTLIANADGDGVPDIADACPHTPGPTASGGCPDTDRDGILDRNDKCPKVAGLGAFGCPSTTDDQVVAFVDGKRVGSTYVMTLHGDYAFKGSAATEPGRHTLKLVWYSGSRLVKTISRTVSV
ncbi:MAG TPA: thrombospondin type 3 repeat-containing protein [Mycobacteriales bacterium]|nr:thrombospondin type 3 repeat-containing protein [Mycobacteriales bacterium]